MYISNPIPTNFKYLHEDGSTQLFVDIEKPDGVSLLVESYGFAVRDKPKRALTNRAGRVIVNP